MDQLTIYHGGTILTMEEPLFAEAMLVQNGRIGAVGSLEDVRRAAGELGGPVETVNLQGHTLMPSFLDPHSHFSAYANSLLQIPLDETVTVEEIQAKIRDYVAQNHPEPGKWLIAKGYDHNRLPGRRHLTRRELDEAAPDNPLVVSHQSGHMGVFNTAALDRMGVTPDTPSPEGGVIGTANGELTGYMEENAFIHYLTQVENPGGKELLAAFQTAQDRYASYGITTIQEGMIMDSMIPLYAALLGQNMLKLDLVGYPSPDQGAGFLKEFSACAGVYQNRFKIGGYKIFLDGSPQGRTAWMRRPYLPDGSGDAGYRGYNTMTDEGVLEAARLSLATGRQLLAHCNGDAAAEQYISAWETVAKELMVQGKTEEEALETIRALRPVIVHGQLMGRDQLPRAARLGLIPSFFVAHVYHWGDTHIRNFGMDRAAHISAAGSALKEHIRFTFHQDSPVIEPNMLETVWCAVNRRTRDGVLLGTDERISVLEALKAVTINSAYQYFEEREKGSLKPGKRADLVVLSENPLEVPVEELRRIAVMGTAKDGEWVYRDPNLSF